jgi:hypothetical protein
VTVEFANKFAEDWIRSWNAHDLDQILKHYAEKVEFYSPFIQKLLGDPTGKVDGRSALRTYFTKGLSAYPDLRFELYATLVGVRSITLYYRSVNNLTAAEVMIFDEDSLVRTVYAHYDKI